MYVHETQGLCPICLKRVSARYEERVVTPAAKGNAANPASTEVLFSPECPEHGTFSSVVWRGQPGISTWNRPKIPSFPARPATAAQQGCPFDCGLCPEHAQHTCTGQMEVTQRCNMACPVCYAGAGGEAPDPELETLAWQLDCLYKAAGPCNVQLSGGEPTVRDDMPAIIALARRKFPFVQLNTNGLRLGSEPGYARQLAAAGLDSVYLQFDALDDGASTVLRGRPCLEQKKAALHACAEAGLGVVLVATVVAGVNENSLGDLLRFAVDQGPAVRGLHLQPAARFGRFPGHLGQKRLTLPEIMRLLEAQTKSFPLSSLDFHPPGCEHSLCSFSAVYRREKNGLTLAAAPSGALGTCCEAIPAAEGARKAKAFTARHWAGQSLAPSEPAVLDNSKTAAPFEPALQDDFDRFLAKAGLAQRFTLSCMAFQEARTLDIERVRGCCIHVVSPQGRLVPFCLYNVSSDSGQTLYRGHEGPRAEAGGERA